MEVDFVLIVAILLGFRALVSMDVAQAMVALGFISLIGYTKYLETKKQPDINAEIRKQLEEMQSKVSSIFVKNAAKPTTPPDGKRFF